MLSRPSSLSSGGDRVREISVVVVLVSLVAGSWSFQLGPGHVDFVVSLGGVLSLVLPVMLMFTILGLRTRRYGNDAIVWMTVLMWAWILWLVISSIWSDFDGDDTHNIRNLLVLGLASTLLSHFWPHLGEDGRERVLATVLFVTVGIFLLAVLVPSPDSDRLLFPGGGPITFSRLMALGFLLAIYVGIRKKMNSAAALSTIFLVGMFFAGSRGVFVAFVMASLLTLVAIWRAKKASTAEIRRHLVVFACSCLALYSLVRWSPSVLWYISGVSVTSSSSVVLRRYTELGLTYTTGRDVLFLHAWDLFTQNPLWGVGLDGYRTSFAMAFPDFPIKGEMYAHNIFLSSLAEGGIVGFFLILCFFAMFLISVRRSLGESRVLLLASVSIFFLLQSQVSGDYYDSRLFWIFAMLAAADSRRPERVRDMPPQTRTGFWQSSPFAKFGLSSEAKGSQQNRLDTFGPESSAELPR